MIYIRAKVKETRIDNLKRRKRGSLVYLHVGVSTTVVEQKEDISLACTKIFRPIYLVGYVERIF